MQLMVRFSKYVIIFIGVNCKLHLKFGGNWILHSDVLEFRFYPLKFGDVWILDHDVSKFEFYLLNFKSI